MESEQGIAIPVPVIRVEPDMVLDSAEAQQADLAYITDLVDQYNRGKIDRRDFRRLAFGQTYEEGEQEDIQIFFESYVCTPEGKAEIAKLAAEMMANDLDSEVDRLVERGLITKEGVPNGTQGIDLRESGMAGRGDDSPGDPGSPV